MIDLKRNCDTLEIINSISSFENEESSFVLTMKLLIVLAVSMKSIRLHIHGNEPEF